jgi:Tautomerase enzyme
MRWPVLIRSQATNGRTAPTRQGKVLRSDRGTPFQGQIARNRPQTGAGIPGTSENRYNLPQVRGSSGECRIREILMPLVRVTMIKGKSPDYIKKMSDSIYEALVEAYQMAENDLFQIIEQLEPGDLIYDRHYGIKGSRSGDFIIINIESDARRRGEKEAFLARLSDKLAASPGIARDDVFVRLSMTAGLEDWSLGSGIAASKS